MNKNILIAHTDSETTFISLSKMEHSDGSGSEYTVTVMTNPNYKDNYDDYTLVCKSFYKAWGKFKEEIANHDIGGLCFDDFEETQSAAIAWRNGIIMELRSAYECGWSLETNTEFFEEKNGKLTNYDYAEYSHITDAMEALRKKADEYGIENILINPYYNDEANLTEIDRRHDEYARQEFYRDACNLEWQCGDSSLMRRYERIYGDE